MESANRSKGGYTAGSKEGSGNPTGLIEASQANGADGVIFVAMNYRLGALGWLAGETLQKSGGVSNAGLYDQRLAIEWVAQYIHLFGGDPNQITLLGESAGGKFDIPNVHLRLTIEQVAPLSTRSRLSVVNKAYLSNEQFLNHQVSNSSVPRRTKNRPPNCFCTS